MRTQRRSDAVAEINAARAHLMNARKLIDGLGETAEHNGTTALVATDDFKDAVVQGERTDREIRAMEQANE